MRLENNKLNGYVWNCNLTYNIGKIEPKKSIEFELDLIPFSSGFLVTVFLGFLIWLRYKLESMNMIFLFYLSIQTISGISVTDLFLKRIHEFTHVANVFINSRDDMIEWWEKILRCAIDCEASIITITIKIELLLNNVTYVHYLDIIFWQTFLLFT